MRHHAAQTHISPQVRWPYYFNSERWSVSTVGKKIGQNERYWPANTCWLCSCAPLCACHAYLVCACSQISTSSCRVASHWTKLQTDRAKISFFTFSSDLKTVFIFLPFSFYNIYLPLLFLFRSYSPVPFHVVLYCPPHPVLLLWFYIRLAWRHDSPVGGCRTEGLAVAAGNSQTLRVSRLHRSELYEKETTRLSWAELSCSVLSRRPTSGLQRALFRGSKVTWKPVGGRSRSLSLCCVGRASWSVPLLRLPRFARRTSCLG